MGPAQLHINKTFYDKTLIKVNPIKEKYTLPSNSVPLFIVIIIRTPSSYLYHKIPTYKYFVIIT